MRSYDHAKRFIKCISHVLIISFHAALRVCEAFVTSEPATPLAHARPFMYISAEDVFRPFISPRYIETKREAEAGIMRMTASSPAYRGVCVRPSACFRPFIRSFIDEININIGDDRTFAREMGHVNFSGLIYHPHFRPLTSPLAALLDLSATVHAGAPPNLPTPSGVLRALGGAPAGAEDTVQPSALHSIANALTIPPIHVDHVAEAVCVAAEETREDVRGVVGVNEMRRLIGWAEEGRDPTEGSVHV